MSKTVPEIDTAHEAVPASEQAEKRTEQTHSLMIGNAIGGQVILVRKSLSYCVSHSNVT